jgi:hypothetical protein
MSYRDLTPGMGIYFTNHPVSLVYEARHDDAANRSGTRHVHLCLHCGKETVGGWRMRQGARTPLALASLNFWAMMVQSFSSGAEAQNLGFSFQETPGFRPDRLGRRSSVIRGTISFTRGTRDLIGLQPNCFGIRLQSSCRVLACSR